jgi:hypothetical protein
MTTAPAAVARWSRISIKFFRIEFRLKPLLSCLYPLAEANGDENIAPNPRFIAVPFMGRINKSRKWL